MEIHNIPADLKLFYVEATTFPEGIKPAFEKLEKLVPPKPGRQCFGIYQETPEGVSYKAATLETEDGEGERLGCRYFTLEKGAYLSRNMMDWQSKIDAIGPAFEEMLRHEKADPKSPCVEYYKNMQELVLLVRTK